MHAADSTARAPGHTLHSVKVPNALVTAALAAVVVVASAAPATAVDGRLDRRFSGDGRATTFSGGAVPFAVAIDDQRRIVVAGCTTGDGGTDIAVARFRPGGGLDPDFGGGDGRVTIDLGGSDFGFDLAIQVDGRIVVAGERATATSDDMLVVRLLGNGALDDSFSGDGRLLVDFGRPFQAASAVAIDRNDRIVVGGSTSGGSRSRWALARILADGTLDASFSGDGLQATDMSKGAEQIHDLQVDAANRVIAVGTAAVRGRARFAIARYTEAGPLDGSFSGNGREFTDVAPGADVAFALALVPGGGYLAAGQAADGGRDSWAAVRYRQRGGLVPSFGRRGIRVIDLGPGNEFAHDALLRSNGKILLAGRGHRAAHGADILVIRLLEGGAFDRSFAGDGRSFIDFSGEDDTARALVVDRFGRVVVTGEARKGSVTRFGVTRLRAN